MSECDPCNPAEFTAVICPPGPTGPTGPCPVGDIVHVKRLASFAGFALAVWTAIPWDTETTDTGGFFTIGSPTRVTIPAGKGGLWSFTASLAFDAMVSLDTLVHSGFRRNGSTTDHFASQTDFVDLDLLSLRPSAISRSGVIELVPGDFVEFVVNPLMSALLATNNTRGECRMYAHRVACS